VAFSPVKASALCRKLDVHLKRRAVINKNTLCISRTKTTAIVVFNSIQFILYYKLASEGFTICLHTTSLTFDLTSDQKKLPKNPFTGEKGKKPSGEQQRRIPLQDGQKNICQVTR